MEADLQTLRAQIRVLNARVADLEAQGTEKDELIRKLQHQLSQALRWQYGQKADRVDPNQLLLDICAQLQAAVKTPPAPEPPPPPRTPRPRQGDHGRRPIPPDIERRTEIHDLPSEQQQCACGRPLRCIGEERSVQFEYIRAKLIAVEHVRKKYACVSPRARSARRPSLPRPSRRAWPRPAC